MGKIIKNLRIGVDIRSLTEKTIDENTKNLLRHHSWKGSLGAITVFSEIFELYLLLPQSPNLQDEELKRWLEAAQINKCFRKFISIDEKIRDSLLEQSIGVTITSDHLLADKLKTSGRVYLLKRYHLVSNIDNQIQKVSQWREIVRDLSFFSSNTQ